jgi:hypothetical protein
MLNIYASPQWAISPEFTLLLVDSMLTQTLGTSLPDMPPAPDLSEFVTSSSSRSTNALPSPELMTLVSGMLSGWGWGWDWDSGWDSGTSWTTQR